MDLVSLCVSPFRKSNNNRKLPNTPPVTQKGRGRLQFLGSGAWPLALKKLAIAASPQTLSAFSAQDLASVLFRRARVLPSLLQEKCSEPALKFCPALAADLELEGRPGHRPQHPGGAAPRGLGTEGQTKTPVSRSNKKMENTVFALESFYI